MISIRRSPATERNSEVRKREVDATSNVQWLAESHVREGIILFGGSSVADFRLRVAQSHLRTDLTPSCWSLAGILLDDATFASVPLDLSGDASVVPRTNAVQTCRLADYDDPARFPNIAIVQFAEGADVIRNAIQLIARERSIIDLPDFLAVWLRFVWGAGQQANPLLQERGIPSAIFVETAYAIAGIELTPGLSSSTSCPEAIWQSAVWWQEFFETAQGARDEKRATPIVPRGEYMLRQPAAMVAEIEKPSPPAMQTKRPPRRAPRAGTRRRRR